MKELIESSIIKTYDEYVTLKNFFNDYFYDFRDYSMIIFDIIRGFSINEYCNFYTVTLLKIKGTEIIIAI